MKIIATLVLFLNGLACFCQTSEQIDSLINELCNYRLKNKSASEREMELGEISIQRPFFDKYSSDSVIFEIFIKFDSAKRCNKRYTQILEKEKLRGDWEIITGQTSEQKDSLIEEICNSLKSNNELEKTKRWLYAYLEHLYLIYSQIDDKRDKYIIEWALGVRLYRNCPEYRSIQGETTYEGDWQRVFEKPSCQLDKIECKQFKEHSTLFYFEPNGKHVEVKIINGHWVEFYKYSTYADYKIQWLTNSKFELEFIESNEGSRKNFNHKGEKYQYFLIDQVGDYYEMLMIVPGTNDHLRFKLYF